MTTPSELLRRAAANLTMLAAKVSIDAIPHGFDVFTLRDDATALRRLADVFEKPTEQMKSAALSGYLKQDDAFPDRFHHAIIAAIEAAIDPAP